MGLGKVKWDKLRLNCTNCGGTGSPVTKDPFCKTVKCNSCGNTWDGISEDIERNVYERLN